MGSDGWGRLVGALCLVLGLGLTTNVGGFRDRMNRLNDPIRDRQGRSRVGEWMGFGSDDDIAVQHGIVRAIGWFTVAFGAVLSWVSWR